MGANEHWTDVIRNRLLHDLRARPAAAILVIVALALSAAIGGIGAGIAAQLVSSTGALFEEGRAPDLVQMHAGEVDPAAIASFAASRPEITDASVRELVALDSTTLALTPETTEAERFIEFFAVAQHDRMDVLVDANGGPAAVGPGQIGVPVDLASDRGIEVGDTITIGSGSERHQFTVSTLIRDAIMNSSLASSRRLLVAEADLDALPAVSTGSEWLIEFALTDAALSSQVYDAYLDDDLPSNGPQVDRGTFELMAGLTDGLASAAVFAIAGLLAIIAALILSITVRTAIAAERRQIGVLRAIGLPGRRLRRLVLGSHDVLLGVGTVLGAIAATAAIPLATGAVRQRLGGDVTFGSFVAAVIIAAVTFTLGALIARAAIRPALRKPPLEVMRATRLPRRTAHRRTARIRPTWVTLARAELVRAPIDHLAVAGVLFAATLMAALPVSLAATFASPHFVSATGIAVSDVRIDLRQDAQQQARLATVEAALATDADIARSTTLSTVRVLAEARDGTFTGINVESGDHTMFPLDHRHGRPPPAANEIAVSELNAQDFEVTVGDALTLRLGDRDVTYAVVGVYRDVTNGGRTAKAVLPLGVGAPLWNVVLADVRDGVDETTVVQRYAELAAPARVTDVEAARADLLGPLERTVRVIAWGTVCAGVMLVAVLTGLLLRLMLVRGARRQAVMQAIGAPLRSLRGATLAQLLAPAAAGTVAGATLGPAVTSGLLAAVGSLFGASSLPLDAAPMATMLGIPALFIVIVAAVTWYGVRRIAPSRVAATVAGQDE